MNSTQASTIILIEHRSLDALIDGMLYLVWQIRLGAKPNFEVFDAMIQYIEAFPERFHHPKEDAYLFKRLRERHPDAAPVTAAPAMLFRAWQSDTNGHHTARTGLRVLGG